MNDIELPRMRYRLADHVGLVLDDVYAAIQGRVEVGRSQRIEVPGKSGSHTLYEVLTLARS